MTSAASTRPELVHDVLRHARRRPLDALFAPRNVALIGASDKPGSVGKALLQNLQFLDGRVFPVNPKHQVIDGLQAFPDVASVPERIDLAVIATPAATAPGVIRDCATAGVPAAIIVSAGFRECGKEGVELERQCLAEARRGQMRLLGPNCLGLMAPRARLNATFAEGIAKPGDVAFLSQSGALCAAVLDWSFRENVGFSAFVSVGSMLDTGWGDLITYLGDDPHTKSIVCYMESVGDARSFLSAAREVALTKPIVVLKVGHTDAAAKAAASHTGALTGSDAVLDAAFRRAGVLRVNTIGELFNMAELLSKQPRPHGPRLAIVTNAGGPGALATDALVASGGQLTALSQDTRDDLDALLPAHWSHDNPIDVLGDADAARYAKAVELAIRDPQSDGVLVILTPQGMTDAKGTAEAIRAKQTMKPLLASWMGGAGVDAAKGVLNAAGIATFDYPDTAARAFALMWRYSDNLRALYETPTVDPESEPTSVSGSSSTEQRALTPGCSKPEADALIAAARKAGRTLLTEIESKRLLSAYGIPANETDVAFTEDEAVKHAERLGFPVVIKLFSETLTHKADVGGVCLDVRNAAGVRRAWTRIHSSVSEKAGREHFLGVTVQPMVAHDGCELILGSSIDPQFGPVLLFGAGGQFVEVFQDRALGLPPLNATLARRLMERTKVFAALKGVRGRKAVDLAALEQLLVRFSQLVAEQRWIAEIDVNPLLVSSERMLSLDARIVLHPPSCREEELPRLAIRPYPARYIKPWKLRDGAWATIRPIRPEDEPLMVKFHQTLSDRSVYLRYFAPLKLDRRIAHERLSRICFVDYDREMVLVVERRDSKTQGAEILGVGRLSKLHGASEAEFALTVSDQWQGHGLGTQLLKLLVEVGRDEKLERITATMLHENHEMQHVARKAGFKVELIRGENEYRAELIL
ncbi:MAG: bifunctional acetate--CoA ligase family protein/GNAT family N-acetyltransferase [Verrucomicrobia bacterium]|nr:bifunctional acetate--CoA ligase family protein/GNAT family N-acetyltransferase [Verrucomicrobiota bacterium]